jgi:tetratricopeptide (TPR) repeat protein
MQSPSILLRNSPLLLIGLLLALAGPSAVARAADSAEVKQAREHYKKGDEAFKAGRYDEAFKEFEAGFTLSNRPLFLLNMAHAERRRGELQSARALYKRFLLMEPDSRLRGEVESVLQEIDTALAAEDAAKRNGPAAPGADAPAASVAPPPAPAAPLALVPPPPSAPASDMGTAGTFTSGPAADEGAERPLYKKGWFWGVVGGVVAAGVLTAVLMSGRASYEKSGSLGTVGSP